MIWETGQYKEAMVNPCGRKKRKFHKNRREAFGAEDRVVRHEVEEKQVRYPAKWEGGLAVS